MKKNWLVSLGLVALVVLGLWPISANALGVTPKTLPGEESRSWFVYTLKPGDAREDIVTITNSDSKSVTVVIEALDAVNASGGGFSLVENVKNNQDVGTWITIAQPEITIPAGSSVDVKFTIKVPDNASIGQHSAGIAVYAKTPGATSGIGLQIRVGARIYITVPGKVARKLTWQSVTHEIKDGKLVFHIKARNDSNINIEPALDVNLRGIFRTVRETQDANGTYLPGNTMDITKVWSHPMPWMGFYRVRLVLHTLSSEEVLPDGTTNQLSDQQFVYSLKFWVGTSWMLIILTILLSIWIIYRLWVYSLDKAVYRTRTEVYLVKNGESVMHIAEKTGIFSQTIIKFNRLKWPFTIQAGDKLLIPIGMLKPDELYRKQQTTSLPAVWRYLTSFRTSLYSPMAHRKLSDKLIIVKSRTQKSKGHK